MSASEPADIKVEFGTYGLKKLTINGQDISDSVSRVVVSSGANEVPVVTISMTPEPFDIDGPGVVAIPVEGNSEDRAADLIAILESLNPAELDGMALSNASWGESAGSGAILEAIKAKIRGE